MSVRDNDIIASGRSVEGFNLVKLLDELKNYFSHYGGHAMACGFALKNKNDLKQFENDIKKIAEIRLNKVDLRKKIFVDAEINLSDITWEIQENLEKFKPFGQANKRPIFLLKNLTIENLERVGADGKHLKIFVNGGKKLIYFFSNNDTSWQMVGKKIDVLIELGVNQWNGTKELQMKVIDVKKHGY